VSRAQDDAKEGFTGQFNFVSASTDTEMKMAQPGRRSA
jgi:hypothetical protein